MQAYVRDRVTGAVTRESAGSDGAVAAADAGVRGISADGRHVAFVSVDDDLIPEPSILGDLDVYLARMW